MFKSEAEAIKHYKDMWKDAPYPPTFVTVDVAIEWNNSILLIKRGDFPGKGKWALPGGFLDKGETIKEAAMRELKEETDIEIGEEIERAELQVREPFVVDTPDRDPRGRYITHVFPFRVWGTSWEPKAIAGDDAAHVEWVNQDDIYDMTADDFFADHYDIIRKVIEV